MNLPGAGVQAPVPFPKPSLSSKRPSGLGLKWVIPALLGLLTLGVCSHFLPNSSPKVSQTNEERTARVPALLEPPNSHVSTAPTQTLSSVRAVILAATSNAAPMTLAQANPTGPSPERDLNRVMETEPPQVDLRAEPLSVEVSRASNSGDAGKGKARGGDNPARARTGNALEMGPGGELVMHLIHGSIEVLTWASNQVKAVAVAENQEDANAATAALRLSREGSRVKIEVPPNSKDRIRYRLLVPPKFNLNLEVMEGGIRITNLEGNVKASTKRGLINLARINGLVTAESPGGSISLQGATGPTKLKTSSGNLTVGELSGETTLEAPGGSILVLLARGRLKAKTSGGNIEVGTALSSVQAETSGGWIKVGFRGQPDADSHLRAQGGSVEARLDPKLAFEVSTHCPQGRLRTELPVNWQAPEKNRSRLGRLNGGGRRLELKTTGGEIRMLPLPPAALPSVEREFAFPKPSGTALTHVGQDPNLLPQVPGAVRPNAPAPPRGSGASSPPKDLFATEAEPGPKMPAGLLLRDGSQLPATIVSLDELQLAFRGAGGKAESLPRARVAAVLFHSLPEARRTMLEHDTPGLLLRNGDFVEGDLKSIRNGQAVISSVLLGLRSVNLERDAVALVMWPTRTAARQ